MAYEIKQQIYDNIINICMDGHDTKIQPIELMEKVWEDKDFPMHCPEHHFLVPAVLLTAYRRLRGDEQSVLERDLELAQERAKNLLAGFCGWYGACGAAVGSGVFLSLLTDTSPYSVKTWAQANMLTARCLEQIAQLGGPRCCKRVCYTSVLTTAQFMKEQFGLDIGSLPQPKCSYSQRNDECRKALCPYYAEGELS